MQHLNFGSRPCASNFLSYKENLGEKVSMVRAQAIASDGAKVGIPGIPLLLSSAFGTLLVWVVPAISLPVVLVFSMAWIFVIVKNALATGRASPREFAEPASELRSSAWSDFLVILALEIPFLVYMTIDALSRSSPAFWIYALCPIVTLVGYRGLRFWRRSWKYGSL